MLNIKEAVVGWATRLRFITRFSNCPRIHDESVAEHSFYTAYYALLMSVHLNRSGSKLNTGRVLAKALMHDIDECFSGDFIRMFKHSNPVLKEEIDKACKNFSVQLVKDLTPDLTLQEELYHYWEDSKKEPEGRVVAFADFLSVVSYISQEIEAGNHRMLLQVPEVRKFYNSFDKIEYEFIMRHFAKQVDVIIKKMEREKEAKEFLLTEVGNEPTKV